MKLTKAAMAAVLIGGMLTVGSAAFAETTGRFDRDGQTLFYVGTTATLSGLTGHGVVHSDFDGDGLDDLAGSAQTTGDPLADQSSTLVAEGVVVVRYSGTPRTDYFIGSTGYDVQSCCLGAAMTTGDFNNDGYDDLAIGFPNEGIDGSGIAATGGVWFLYGGPDGLRLDATVAHFNENTSFVPGSAESTDNFGGSLAAGDLNDDGYDDIAIGAPGESIGTLASAGSVTVLYGGAFGVSATKSVAFSQNTAGVPGTAEAGDNFGSSVAIGDVTGDGKVDLAVASRFEVSSKNATHGMIMLLKGSSSGVSLSGASTVNSDQLWDSDLSAGVFPDGLGQTITIADVNADGHADIISGVPGATVNGSGSGAVVTLFGQSTGITASNHQYISQSTANVPGASESGDAFGASIAVGDVTGDGKPDLVVGAPGEQVGSVSDAGSAWVIPGNGHGFTGTGSIGFSQNTTGVPGTAEMGDEFGNGVAVANVNGSGGLDLVISTWLEENGSEAQYQGSGMVTTLSVKSGALATLGSYSGSSLATPDFGLLSFGLTVCPTTGTS